MKQYKYVNDLGLNKCLTVNNTEPNERGKYPVILWCIDTGEICGLDCLGHDELAEFLAHYGIAIDF